MLGIVANHIVTACAEALCAVNLGYIIFCVDSFVSEVAGLVSGSIKMFPLSSERLFLSFEVVTCMHY